MRNVIKHPVTTDEIVKLLEQFRFEKRETADDACGYMTDLVLREAIGRLSQTVTYIVVHGDEHGNYVVVSDGLSKEAAQSLQNHFNEHYGDDAVFTCRHDR